MDTMESLDQTVQSVQSSGSGMTPGITPPLSDVENKEPKDEEIYADVDNLMDRVAELERLTTEALEVLPDRGAPTNAGSSMDASLALSSFSVGGTDFRRGLGTVEEAFEKRDPIQGVMSKLTPEPLALDRKEPRRSNSSSLASDTPSLPAKRQGITSSPGPGSMQPIVFEGLQQALKNFEKSHSVDEKPTSQGSGESVQEVGIDDVLDDFQKRISNIEKEITVWSSHLEESEIRIRTEVFVKLEQVIEEKLLIKSQALEAQLKSKFASLQGDSKSTASASPESSQRDSSVKGQKGTGRQSGTQSSVSRMRSGPTPKQPGGKGQQRNSLASPTTPQKGATEGSSSTSQAASQAAETAKKERAEELVSLKSSVLTELTGQVDQLRQEVFGVEQRIKLYVRDYIEAETMARQELHREIEKEAKSRMTDSGAVRKSWGSGPPQDVLSVGSTAFDGTRTSEHCDSFAVISDVPAETKMGRIGESDLPMGSAGQQKRVVDMQLGNVASRCAWLTETLSSCSHIVDEQVGKHMIQLANDLEKVATYLSGALQLQLESKTEVISLLQRQLEHITKVLLPAPHGPPSSGLSTGVSTVISTPLMRSTTPIRGPLLPAVTRMLSGEDTFKSALQEHAMKAGKMTYSPTTTPPPVRPGTAVSPHPRTASPFERAEDIPLVNGPVTLTAPIVSPPGSHVRTSSPSRHQASQSSTPQQPVVKSVISIPQQQSFQSGGSVSLPIRGRSQSPSATQASPVPVSQVLTSSLRSLASRSTWSPTSASLPQASHSLNVPLVVPSRTSIGVGAGVTMQEPSAKQRPKRSPGPIQRGTNIERIEASPMGNSIARQSSGGTTTMTESSSQTGASLKATAWQGNSPPPFTFAASPITQATSFDSNSVTGPASTHGLNTASTQASANSANVTNHEPASPGPPLSATPNFPSTTSGQSASFLSDLGRGSDPGQGMGPSSSPQEKIHRPRSRLSIVEARLDALELSKEDRAALGFSR